MSDQEVQIDVVERTLAGQWELESTGAEDLEALRLVLRDRLKVLLTDDFQRLVQTMYRLDVAESKFATATALPSVDAQADALSKIVLERELQRIAFRQRYQQQTKPN